MIFKLGTCLLVAMTTLSLACAAQAEVIFHRPPSAALEGEGIGIDRFETAGTRIACREANYRGGYGSGNAKSIVLEPEYEHCTTEALAGFPADFYQELCNYVLHDARQAGEGWRAAVDLQCTSSEWDSVGWDIFETEAAYGEARPFCSTRVPEQTLGTAELRNLPKHRGIEIHWNLHDFEYTVGTLRGAGSSLLCGSTLHRTRSDARYSGTATVAAREYNSGSVPFYITGR